MSIIEEFSIEIYERNHENLEIVKRICRDFGYFNFYLEFFEDDYYKVFFGKISNKKVGIGVCSRHGIVMSGDFLWIDENFRKKGLGSFMITYMIEMTRNAGLRALIGDTLETDKGAIRLYQKIAGNSIGRYENLYGDGTQIMYRIKIPENMKK